ncbi:MAG TPA: hypothetical protein VFU23_10745, partial [Gemmatimonadales bacterium]|nr:hypothetical protein [Gemmatimonadales bacterium]
MTTTHNTLRLTILAQDPAVRLGGRRLAVSRVEVPAETLAPGPVGYRVRVIDFDGTTNRLYLPHTYEIDPKTGELIDPWAPPAEDASAAVWRRYEDRILGDPQFHAQNAFAIAMRTLARFEQALGRRVAWGFESHQLQIAPHAFCDANAFYSEYDHALLLGYFPGRNGENVFTCLSHDVIAHETTHALLDGMRDRFTEPSSPDQAAFHEGFADVVAILSMFSLEEIVRAALGGAQAKRGPGSFDLVPERFLTSEALKESILFGLAKQVGIELEPLKRDALRRSINIEPSRDILNRPEYLEPHNRGEVLVAAFLRGFLELWERRIAQIGTFGRGLRNLDMVIDEGVKAADHLLTIAIRALDYCPATDIDFPDFLAALLTADAEVAPDDRKYRYRDTIRKAFYAYGIDPPPDRCNPDGTWTRYSGTELTYSRTHFESMLRDKEEVFRFVWENRFALGVDDRGYTEVQFVRTSTPIGPDGFVLHETICEYVQVVQLFAAEMKAVLGFERPAGMLTTQNITVYAGGTLVFDEYGKVKYHIAHPLTEVKRQQARMEYLYRTGFFEET